MSSFLGIDTSNYRTSVGIVRDGGFDSFTKLIPVPKGSVGIRQSDAVFHHTKQLFPLLEKALSSSLTIEGIGVSVSPRPVVGSYMPCFLAGETMAKSLGLALNVPVYLFSHQEGHIMSSLYGSNSMSLLSNKFFAWHVSGGTTECHLCIPNENNLFSVNLISTSTDLKAGQAIDRLGVLMGLPFPCGKYLEALADKRSKSFPITVSMDKASPENFSLSGLQNKTEKMLNDGESKENIAGYCLDFIAKTLIESTKSLIMKFGNHPVLCCGGVFSNKMISKKMIESFDARTCSSELSSDNAVGVALLARMSRETHE